MSSRIIIIMAVNVENTDQVFDACYLGNPHDSATKMGVHTHPALQARKLRFAEVQRACDRAGLDPRRLKHFANWFGGL